MYYNNSILIMSMSKNKINDDKANYFVSTKNNDGDYSNEIGDEPKHYKSLKYHSDTISQLVFNPNK